MIASRDVYNMKKRKYKNNKIRTWFYAFHFFAETADGIDDEINKVCETEKINVLYVERLEVLLWLSKCP